MSLVNEMLKNLDKQQRARASEGPEAAALMAQLQLPMLPSSKLSKVLANFKLWGLSFGAWIGAWLSRLSLRQVLMLVIMLGGLGGWYLATPLIQKFAKQFVRLSTKQVLLQSLSVNNTEAQVVLKFSFDRAVHYQFSENRDHSTLALTLQNVALAAPVSWVPVGFIKAITSTKSAANLQVTITTPPGTEAKVMYDATSKPVTLLFILSNKAGLPGPPQPVITKIVAPVPPEDRSLLDYQDALVFIANGYVEQAIGQLSRILEAKPEFTEARVKLVLLLLQQGEAARAFDQIKAGLKLSGDNVELLMLQAKLLLKRGECQAALRSLQTIAPQLREEPEYYALLASIYQQLNQATLAEQLYRQLLELDLSNANWLVGLALALESQQKPHDALQVYLEAAHLHTLAPGLQQTVEERIVKLGGRL